VCEINEKPYDQYKSHTIKALTSAGYPISSKLKANFTRAIKTALYIAADLLAAGRTISALIDI